MIITSRFSFSSFSFFIKVTIFSLTHFSGDRGENVIGNAPIHNYSLDRLIIDLGLLVLHLLSQMYRIMIQPRILNTFVSSILNTFRGSSILRICYVMICKVDNERQSTPCVSTYIWSQCNDIFILRMYAFERREKVLRIGRMFGSDQKIRLHHFWYDFLTV